jgi:predicted DNA-binding transcriptional regulator AlpA
MDSKDLPGRLLSHFEAASLLGISPSTLAKMRLSATGPAYVKLGRRVLYEQSSIDEFIREQTRLSTSEEGKVSAATKK